MNLEPIFENRVIAVESYILNRDESIKSQLFQKTTWPVRGMITHYFRIKDNIYDQKNRIY